MRAGASARWRGKNRPGHAERVSGRRRRGRLGEPYEDQPAARRRATGGSALSDSGFVTRGTLAPASRSSNRIDAVMARAWRARAARHGPGPRRPAGGECRRGEAAEQEGGRRRVTAPGRAGGGRRGRPHGVRECRARLPPRGCSDAVRRAAGNARRTPCPGSGARVAADDETVTIHVTPRGGTGRAITVTGAGATAPCGDPLTSRGRRPPGGRVPRGRDTPEGPLPPSGCGPSTVSSEGQRTRTAPDAG